MPSRRHVLWRRKFGQYFCQIVIFCAIILRNAQVSVGTSINHPQKATVIRDSGGTWWFNVWDSFWLRNNFIKRYGKYTDTETLKSMMQVHFTRTSLSRKFRDWCDGKPFTIYQWTNSSYHRSRYRRYLNAQWISSIQLGANIWGRFLCYF